MARREVTEKTGEINVCGQLLRLVQRRHRGAYWMGTSTRAEAQLAYDAALMTGASGVAFLQFKAANTRKGHVSFHINGSQFLTLARWSNLNHGSTFYALPAFRKQHELMAAAPNFLSRTCFVDLDAMTAFPRGGQNFHVLLIGAEIVLDGNPRVKAPCVSGKTLIEKLPDLQVARSQDVRLEQLLFAPQPGVRQPVLLVLP